VLLPTNKILIDYCALVLKLHQDADIIKQATHNLELIFDQEVMLGLSYIMSMLGGQMN